MPPDIVLVRDIMYFPELTIDGITHIDVLQHTWFDSTDQFRSDDIHEQAQWVRMLLVRDIGLFQFELLNGDVFTLAR